MVNQVSSVWFENKLLRKSLYNETNFNKCEFGGKFCEFINLSINSVQDSWLKLTKLCWIWLKNFSFGIEYFGQILKYFEYSGYL